MEVSGNYRSTVYTFDSVKGCHFDMSTLLCSFVKAALTGLYDLRGQLCPVVHYRRQNNLSLLTSPNTLSRAGKIDKITFSRFGLPRFKGSAKDLVTIVRKDSPNADSVIEDSHSKGSVILQDETIWTHNLPERVDAALLLACWSSSARKYQLKLDEAFLPVYPQIGNRIPTRLIEDLARITDMYVHSQGMIYCKPQTLVFLHIALKPYHGRMSFLYEWIFHRLRINGETPIYISEELYKWTKTTLVSLKTEYYRNLFMCYNRLNPKCPLDIKTDPDVTEHLVSLPYSAATLEDLIKPLQDVYEAWPHYALYTSNCDMFSRTISYQNLWAGYGVTTWKKHTQQTRLRNVMWMLMVVLIACGVLICLGLFVLTVVAIGFNLGAFISFFPAFESFVR